MKTIPASFLLILLSFPCAGAVSIGVSPHHVYAENNIAYFFIINPNDSSVWYEINAKSLTSRPSSGLLNPRERKKIELDVPFLFEAEQIEIVFAQESISPAIKLLVENNPKEKLKKGFLVAAALIFLGLLLIVFFGML